MSSGRTASPVSTTPGKRRNRAAAVAGTNSVATDSGRGRRDSVRRKTARAAEVFRTEVFRSSVLPQEPAAKSCGTTVGTTAAAREVTAGRTVRTGPSVRHPTGRKAVVITVAATGRRVRNSRENPLPVRRERRTVLPVRSSVPPKGAAAKVRGATAETTAAAREATAGRTVRENPSVRHPTGRKAVAITVAATGRRV